MVPSEVHAFLLEKPTGTLHLGLELVILYLQSLHPKFVIGIVKLGKELPAITLQFESLSVT